MTGNELVFPHPTDPWLWWQGPWGAPDGWAVGVEDPSWPERPACTEGARHTPAGTAPQPAGPVDPRRGAGMTMALGLPQSSQHHAHGVPLPVDVDGVGGLARPEQRPAVDVDAEAVRRLSGSALAREAVTKGCKRTVKKRASAGDEAGEGRRPPPQSTASIQNLNPVWNLPFQPALVHTST